MSAQLVTVVSIIVGLGISAIVLPPVFETLWSVPDQVVEKTGDPNLQNTYETSKVLVNTAEEIEDKHAFTKAILGLALIIGLPASIITAIKKAF